MIHTPATDLLERVELMSNAKRLYFAGGGPWNDLLIGGAAVAPAPSKLKIQFVNLTVP